MAKKRVAKIWEPSKEEFKNIVESSNTFGEILRKCGYEYEYQGGFTKLVKNRMIEDGLSFEDLEVRRKKHISNTLKNRTSKKKDLSEILVENSSYYTSSLKKRLISEGILKNVCCMCGLGEEWNGKPITLQLDHINGVYNDHRLNNLRILCPNCHSQTDNFTGRNKKKVDGNKEILVCSNKHCNNLITKNAKKGLCRNCSTIDYNNKIKGISESLDYDVIYNAIALYGYSKVAKGLNITANGLKVRLNNLGYDMEELKISMEYNKYKNNASGLKFVLLTKYKKENLVFRVSIFYKDKNLYFGSYKTKEEAAKVADEKMIELFGEDVLTNKKLGLIDY